MFNNPRIHLYNKLICLFLSCLVIIFNSSSISLLLMFIIYFMLIKNDDKIYSLIISLFFVLAFALLYIYDVTFWVKLILIVAYAYYYLYLDLSKVKFKKRPVKKEIVEEVKKEEVSKVVKDKVSEELKNGDALTKEEKEQIEKDLDRKVDSEVKEIKENYFLRYYHVQQKLSHRKYDINMENIIYVFVNVLAMVICILVERI